MNAVIRAASYDDILQLPEHVTGEILAGQLHTQPRPSSRHADVETGLAGDLRNAFGRRRGDSGGWLILMEPELHLGEHVMVPDVSGWRRDRLPSAPDGPITTVPNWICEILSPSTARKDRKLKMPIYAALGVDFAWIVDPSLKTIETYRRDGAHWVLIDTFGDQDLMRAEPFESIEIELKYLWDW